MSANNPGHSRQLEHFINCARQGRRPGCSTGERAARKLALAILAHAIGLDDSACAGAAEFLQRAPLAPNAARELIR